jgi:nucleoside-triphosphatase THEP1
MALADNVRLAAVVYQLGFQIDDFLTRVADLLRADQIDVGGVVQENARYAGSCAVMTVVDLATRRRFRISQELGTQAMGCRLDSHGLADIAALLERSLTRGTEIVILNKFGRAEAEGHGLRAAIGRAIDAGIPVVTAVRPPYTEAWSTFHGRLATDLTPDLDVVLAWCRASVGDLRQRAGRSPPATDDSPSQLHE